jgi:TP901 family phage tail tape measure protein
MNTKLSQARNEVKALDTSSQKFGRNFKDIIAGVVGGNLITGAIASLKEFAGAALQYNMDLSDAYSNIQKVTGLTSDSVKELDAQLKSIVTRSSIDELRQLAVEAGKLGIEGVNNISKFVKEADQIRVALGEDLGPEAITQIGRLSQIFSVSMLQIGSAINEIGAQSAATEAFQVDFLNRMAGTGPTAKIAADELLGYSATLENMGQTAEVSGTALSKFFLEFIKDIEKFGNIAGMQKGKLTEVFNSKGTNAAFVAFLENLKKSKNGSVELARSLDEMGIDGARSTGVFLALANSTEELNKQQGIANKALNEGTSLTNEFNIKNQNLAATMEKLKNFLKEAFLNNSITQAISRLAVKFADLVMGTKDANQEFQEMVSNEREMQSQMNVSIDALKSNNLTQEARRELIKEINEKYGEYLPNLLTESSTIDEITAAQKAANKAFERKILLMQFEKELGDATKKLIELEKGKIAAQIAQEKLRQEMRMGMIEDNNIYNQKVNLMKTLDAANAKSLEDTKKTIEEINNLYSTTSKALFGEDVTTGKTGTGKASGGQKSISIPGQPDSKARAKLASDLDAATAMMKEYERNITLLQIDNDYERSRRSVQLDFDSEAEKINNLKISEEKKTELLLAAQRLRDEKLSELEREKKEREDREKEKDAVKDQTTNEKLENTELQDAKDKAQRLKDLQKDAEKQTTTELRNQAFAFIQQEQQEKYARLLSELDKQRELELSNKSLTEEQKDNINITYDQKRKQILNEQAKKERELALFRIGVETAVAAVSALKTDPTGILSALIVAQGLAQAIVVGSKDIPQFAGGGNTLVRGSSDGNLYSADNVGSIAGGGVYNKPSLGIVGEKGAELVIPNWLYSSPRMANTMSALESMIYNARPFAAGGNTVVNNTPGADNSEIAMALKMNAQVMMALKNNLDKGITSKISWGQSEQTEFEKFTNRREQVKSISEL